MLAGDDDDAHRNGLIAELFVASVKLLVAGVELIKKTCEVSQNEKLTTLAIQQFVAMCGTEV